MLEGVQVTGVQTTKTYLQQQESNAIDDEDDEDVELLSVTLAASRLVEESQVSKFYLLICVFEAADELAEPEPWQNM